MWVRDPIRLTCLLIAVIVGAAVCVIPRLTSGTYLVLPVRGDPHRGDRGRLRVQPLRLRRDQPVADRYDPGLQPGRRPQAGRPRG